MTTAHRYVRADVLRILHITAQQLAQWQKSGLVAAGDTFTFYDLLQLKKVRDLRARHVAPAQIRRSLEAMQKQVSGMSNPLVEASAYTSGARVVFRHDGVVVDPTTGQMVMDFTGAERVVAARVHAVAKPAESTNEWFARGVALEEDPASHEEAMAAYRKVLELDPKYAPAHINLGTLHYNRREFRRAEEHYRAAVAADARYALAHFDLGNVLDETGRLAEAVESYRTALTLAPTYADAHYNLALAYEKMREARKALRHWQAYLKLDREGPWAVHARAQIKKILAADRLRVVWRRLG